MSRKAGHGVIVFRQQKRWPQGGSALGFVRPVPFLLCRRFRRRYNGNMHQIDDAIVREGRLVLSNLPFAEGQHVRIFVAELDVPPLKKASIGEIRQLLKAGVERFDDPFGPMIPVENWELLK